MKCSNLVIFRVEKRTIQKAEFLCFTFDFLWLCTIHSDKFLKVKYLNSANYIVLFFVLKIAKCRDFYQKINQTPLLHSDKFSKVKYLNSAYYIALFFVLKIDECKHFFYVFIKVKYFFYHAIMGHFFCQKKSKCRDFDEKINQTPLLYRNNFSKVKYLNSANYIILFFVLQIVKCKHFFLFLY